MKAFFFATALSITLGTQFDFIQNQQCEGMWVVGLYEIIDSYQKMSWDSVIEVEEDCGNWCKDRYF